MKLNLTINGKQVELESAPNETLLKALRRSGYFGVKHGCETGECGACAVLVDGKVVNSCVTLAAQVDGKIVETIEAHRRTSRTGMEAYRGLASAAAVLRGERGSAVRLLHAGDDPGSQRTALPESGSD